MEQIGIPLSHLSCPACLTTPYAHAAPLYTPITSLALQTLSPLTSKLTTAALTINQLLIKYPITSISIILASFAFLIIKLHRANAHVRAKTKSETDALTRAKAAEDDAKARIQAINEHAQARIQAVEDHAKARIQAAEDYAQVRIQAAEEEVRALEAFNQRTQQLIQNYASVISALEVPVSTSQACAKAAEEKETTRTARVTLN